MSFFRDKNIHSTIRSQRNFDWDKPIEQEKFDVLMEYVHKCPQQQGWRTHNIVYIKNNWEMVLDLQTRCFNKDNPIGVPYPQPQMMAPHVFVFTINDDLKKISDQSYINLGLGMHAGIITRVANNLGLESGFTACGPHIDQSWHGWCRKFGVDHTVHDHFVFALSVGYALYEEDHTVVHPKLTIGKLDSDPYNWPQIDQV